MRGVSDARLSLFECSSPNQGRHTPRETIVTPGRKLRTFSDSVRNRIEPPASLRSAPVDALPQGGEQVTPARTMTPESLRTVHPPTPPLPQVWLRFTASAVMQSQSICPLQGFGIHPIDATFPSLASGATERQYSASILQRAPSDPHSYVPSPPVGSTEWPPSADPLPQAMSVTRRDIGIVSGARALRTNAMGDRGSVQRSHAKGKISAEGSPLFSGA